ncbi:hypothetical protein BT63DRAFT_300322 [Microthyrium microscopicum]|uniref:Uncharacterized protein n=1 Tax=Microthyrium microscopicum TaxID=703497 RepID=A0A6A6U7Z4_9PEZI|nr:hypothetical protein BT63DRAFT_300322 [Microthyrium microscopicum]
MNNVWAGIFRQPCVGFQNTLRPTCRILPPLAESLSWKRSAIRDFSLSRKQYAAPRNSTRSKTSRNLQAPRLRRTAPVAQTQRVPALEIRAIFGPSIDVRTGNAVIYELHKRRISGTLVDAGLHIPAYPEITEEQGNRALSWLRFHHPADEAAAAAEYALAEDDKLRAELEEKAANSWLYKNSVKENEDDPQEKAKRLAKKVEEWRENRKRRHIKGALIQYTNDTAMESVDKVDAEMTMKQDELEKAIRELEETHLAIINHQIALAERRDEKLATWDKLEQQATLDFDPEAVKQNPNRVCSPPIPALSLHTKSPPSSAPSCAP